jgi:hypothetical protein
MPESVIRLDADVESVTVKFKKVGDAAKKVGETAAKSFDWTGGLNKTLEGMPARLFTVAAAIKAIGAAAQAANDIADKNAGLAKGRNSLELRAAAAASRAGNVASNRAFIESTASARTTMEGRLGLTESIGQIQEDRRAKGLPQLTLQQIQHMQSLYQSGGDEVFGQNGSDIATALRENPFNPQLALGRRLAGRIGQTYRGQDLGDLTNANVAQLPGGARTAILARAMDERTRRAEYERGAASEGDLMAQSERERFSIDHPIGAALQSGLQNTAGYIPGVAPILEAARRPGEGKGAVEHLAEINKNIRDMAKGPALPNVSTRQEPKP